MPELPEVELAAAKLRRWIVGRTVRAVRALEGPPLRGDTTPGSLNAALVGTRIVAVDRRGKQMMFRTTGAHVLLAHLGMTGSWSPSASDGRVVLELDDGSVVGMEDVRRLGRVRVVEAAALDRAPEWTGLGPDAMEVAAVPGALAAAMGDARVPIKVALMDQGRLAGVGNIYASEACFTVALDPRRLASTIDAETYDRLGVAIVAAMQRTLDEGARNPDFAYLSEGGENVFAVYGREGLPCPVCGTKVERFEQAGRSTFWCKRCQPRWRGRVAKKKKRALAKGSGGAVTKKAVTKKAVTKKAAPKKAAPKKAAPKKAAPKTAVTKKAAPKKATPTPRTEKRPRKTTPRRATRSPPRRPR